MNPDRIVRALEGGGRRDRARDITAAVRPVVDRGTVSHQRIPEQRLRQGRDLQR